jgi:small subunit ribosomal protein S21e
MKGCINQDGKLTDLYLPRKCDFTDRLITPKDNSSIQISICEVNADGTINLAKSNVVTICGYVRSLGQSDSAIEKIIREKGIAA